MAEHSIPIEQAQADLLDCAVYVAENIGSREARAAAMETIISYFIDRDDVDTAAALADAVEDPFVRDRLLSEVVSKCAALDDDEYAFQLIDAIEEHSTQNTAREKVALQKAKKAQFDEALKLAEELDHSSDAFAGIAVNQVIKGFDAEGKSTLGRVDFYNAKVDALQEIAVHHLNNENAEKASNALEEAFKAVDEIEFLEDKIRAMLGIAANYIVSEKDDKAIEIYGKTREFVDSLDGVHKDNLFVQVAIGFLRAGSVDLADRALDLVSDKTQISDCLIGFSQVYREDGESEDALEALEEAYAMLKSQSEMEIRSTKTRFQLFGGIAKEFALLGKVERALEIAHENGDEEQKNLALTNIAQICVLNDSDGLAETAIRGINEDSQRIPALLAVSDAHIKNENTAGAVETLEKVSGLTETIPQFIFRSEILNELTKRFYFCSEIETARTLASKNLETIREIPGNGNRAVALAELSETFKRFDFELSEEDRSVLQTLTRTSNW